MRMKIIQQISKWRFIVFLLVTIIIFLQLVHILLLNKMDHRQNMRNRLDHFIRKDYVNMNSHTPKDAQMLSTMDHFERSRSLFLLLSQLIQCKEVLDRSGDYKIIADLTKPFCSHHPDASDMNSKLKDVTLVTQCSSQHLNLIIELSARWEGFLSVAVFVERHELSSVLWNIINLQTCFPVIQQNVSFHLVMPLSAVSEQMPVEIPKNTDILSCKSYLNGNEKPTSEYINYERNRIPYPVNLLRNVARQSVKTEFLLVIDADILPSIKLREKFIEFAKKSKLFDPVQENDKTVYVIPAFESSQNTYFPTDKKTLKLKIRDGIIRPFYFEMCLKCQVHTNYEAWLQEPNKNEKINTAFDVLWKDPWEPFYICRVSAPLYDERFKQYGFNRISQVCELHIGGYKFSILDNAFLIHKGFKTANSFHTTKTKDLDYNRKLYRQFKFELKERYPNSSRRCY